MKEEKAVLASKSACEDTQCKLVTMDYLTTALTEQEVVDRFRTALQTVDIAPWSVVAIGGDDGPLEHTKVTRTDGTLSDLQVQSRVWVIYVRTTRKFCQRIVGLDRIGHFDEAMKKELPSFTKIGTASMRNGEIMSEEIGEVLFAFAEAVYSEVFD